MELTLVFSLNLLLSKQPTDGEELFRSSKSTSSNLYYQFLSLSSCYTNDSSLPHNKGVLHSPGRPLYRHDGHFISHAAGILFIGITLRSLFYHLIYD